MKTSAPRQYLAPAIKALRQFDEEERKAAQAILEALILKGQAMQSQLRMQPTRNHEKKTVDSRAAQPQSRQRQGPGVRALLRAVGRGPPYPHIGWASAHPMARYGL